MIGERRQTVTKNHGHHHPKHNQNEQDGQKGERQGAAQQPKQAMADLVG